jgi:hypothetical protein
MGVIFGHVQHIGVLLQKIICVVLLRKIILRSFTAQDHLRNFAAQDHLRIFAAQDHLPRVVILTFSCPSGGMRQTAAISRTASSITCGSVGFMDLK